LSQVAYDARAALGGLSFLEHSVSMLRVEEMQRDKRSARTEDEVRRIPYEIRGDPELWRP
jgi:hypothetical protein